MNTNTNLLENPEESDSTDHSGEDTQLRFHYQAQRIACLAVSMISRNADSSIIYCEQHEDCLVKKFDKSFLAYQYKSRNLDQSMFLATGEQISQTIKNFANLHRRFENRIVEYIIASNYDFKAGKDKNDLRYLIHLAINEPADAVLSVFLDHMVAFSKKQLEPAEIIEVLKKVRLQAREPDFPDALQAVVDALKQVPQLSELDDSVLARCAKALVAKVEDGSRKFVPPSGEQLPQEKELIRRIFRKRMSPQIVWTTLEAVVQNPLGTSINRIAVELVPERSMAFVKSAFASSGDSLKANIRTLNDGTKFKRKEMLQLLDFASGRVGSNVCMLLGEPGSGKSALLADFVEELELLGRRVLTLKSGDIPKDIKNQEEFASFWGLPYAAETCIRSLARTESITVVIDQLDAIALLWDTQTARMQMLLPLVYACSKMSNVRVVLSCREFDARFDQRIAQLSATAINLDLPSKDEVKTVLAAHKIDSANWPEDVQGVLRNPQHLDIFVSLLKDASEQLTTVKNYFDLLNVLWSKRVRPGDDSLLANLCDAMTDRKSFAVPVALFDSQRDKLDHLLGSGILKLTNNSNNVEFTHQTLYEYSIARTFIQAGKSLSDFVSKHQDSLHARPLILSCLLYLRECDTTTYERELAMLFQQQLRPHMMALILQFLSQVSKPTSVEITCVMPKILDGGYSDDDLIQLARNPDWFDVLLSTHLPILMNDDTKCDLAAFILGNGCSHRHQQVIAEVNTRWFGLRKRDVPILMVFKQVKNWDESLAVHLSTIIERNNFDRTYLEILLSDLSEHFPQFAVMGVKSWIHRQYVLASALPKIDFIPPPELTEAQAYLWIYRMKREDPRLKSIAEIIDGKDRHFLASMVDRAPDRFVELVWPDFRQMIEELTRDFNATHTSYDNDDVHYTSQSRQSLISSQKNSLTGIFAKHVTTLAGNEKKRFEQFVNDNVDSRSIFIHRLICWGLACLVGDSPTFVFHYLLGDGRRLALGTPGEPHEDTMTLISLLCPHLTLEQMRVLEEYVLNWNMYFSDEILNKIEGRVQWQRQHRLRLLTAIPENLRKEEINNFVASESLELPNFNERLISEPQMSQTVSPMSSEEMVANALSDVQALFSTTPFPQGQQPKIWEEGNLYALCRELERVAQTDAPRALEIASSLVPGKDDLAVAHLVVGLARNDVLLFAEVEEHLRDFVSRAFISETVVVSIAECINHRLTWDKKKPTVSADIIQLIETTIRSLPQVAMPAHSETREPAGTVLWTGSAFLSVPTEGLYPLLTAFTRALFALKNPDENWWLELLHFAVELRHDAWAWQALSLSILTRLNQIDYLLARNFLSILFQKQPELLESRAGAILLCYVVGVLEPEQMQQYIDKITGGSWTLREQIVGELAGQDFYVYRNLWSRHLVAAAFSDSKTNKNFLMGLAYTTGQAWSNSTFRGAARLMLQKIFDLQDKDIIKAASSTMNLSSELLPDKDTLSLIDTLSEQPTLLRYGFADLLRNIGKLLLFDPNRAFKLVDAFAREIGSDFTNHQTRMSIYAELVVNATLTLQKIPTFENKALELFEYLLSLHLREAADAIANIDRYGKLMSHSTNQISW
jgi:hypothetical protein